MYNFVIKFDSTEQMDGFIHWCDTCDFTIEKTTIPKDSYIVQASCQNEQRALDYMHKLGAFKYIGED